MKINTTLVGLADVQRLLDAIQGCGFTPPKQLSDVPSAYEKLTEAPVIVNPVKSLVAGALDGRRTDVNKMLEQTAIARLVAEERKSLNQRVEPELLDVFGRRLDNGGADAVLDLLRPAFTTAADTLRAAQQKVDIDSDPAAFMERASADELAAWQSIRPALAELNKLAAIASAFGPTGPFPCVADPRSVDPAIRAPWLHSVAVMCTNDDLLQACAAFQKPSPIGDIRSSPWLRCQPHLHSVGSARERLRSWCETAWDGEEAQRPKAGRVVNGVIVPDRPRPNPFAAPEAKAS